MFVSNFEPLHVVDVEIFHKIKSKNSDLPVVLEEKSEDHQSRKTLKICSKFHDNQSSSCQDMSLLTIDVNLDGARGKVSKIIILCYRLRWQHGNKMQMWLLSTNTTKYTAVVLIYWFTPYLLFKVKQSIID